MEMEKIIEKIAQYRNKKGYTYENMADELELTPAAYRKIETGAYCGKIIQNFCNFRNTYK